MEVDSENAEPNVTHRLAQDAGTVVRRLAEHVVVANGSVDNGRFAEQQKSIENMVASQRADERIMECCHERMILPCARCYRAPGLKGFGSFVWFCIVSVKFWIVFSWLAGRLASSVTGWLVRWHAGWQASWLVGWQASWQAGWRAGLHAGWRER